MWALKTVADLEEFVVDGNPLEGTLPDGFGGPEWSNLELLSLTDTSLSGNVPNQSCPYAFFDCSEYLCGCDCVCADSA